MPAARTPAVMLRALVRRPSFWILVVGSLAATVLAFALTRAREAAAWPTHPPHASHDGEEHAARPPAPAEPELPVLSAVPAFDFTDQAGKPFTSEALLGQVWVANFIFTRCPTICPPFSAKMASIQKQSAGTALRLVSFTVDPEYDTPEKLLAYGGAYQADFSRWSFVTGPRPRLEAVIVKGMMQPMDKGDGTDLATVVHGSYFVLVDRAMKVRGYYKFDEPAAVDTVLRDARRLLRP